MTGRRRDRLDRGPVEEEFTAGVVDPAADAEQSRQDPGREPDRDAENGLEQRHASRAVALDHLTLATVRGPLARGAHREPADVLHLGVVVGDVAAGRPSGRSARACGRGRPQRRSIGCRRGRTPPRPRGRSPPGPRAPPPPRRTRPARSLPSRAPRPARPGGLRGRERQLDAVVGPLVDDAARGHLAPGLHQPGGGPFLYLAVVLDRIIDFLRPYLDPPWGYASSCSPRRSSRTRWARASSCRGRRSSSSADSMRASASSGCRA